MTFLNFMKRNYKDKETPKGDLARKMAADTGYVPKNGPGKYEGWHRVFINYMQHRGWYGEVFEECWNDYVDYERSRLAGQPCRQKRREA